MSDLLLQGNLDNSAQQRTWLGFLDIRLRGPTERTAFFFKWICFWRNCAKDTSGYWQRAESLRKIKMGCPSILHELSEWNSLRSKQYVSECNDQVCTEYNLLKISKTRCVRTEGHYFLRNIHWDKYILITILIELQIDRAVEYWF